MKSVAIADDEAGLTELLVEVLQNAGFDVVGTGINGKEAVEMCTKFNPDFLLLDLSMPEYDGYYVLDKLQEMKNPVRIIIMTGLPDADIKQKLMSYSNISILPKPMKMDALLEVLKK